MKTSMASSSHAGMQILAIQAALPAVMSCNLHACFAHCWFTWGWPLSHSLELRSPHGSSRHPPLQLLSCKARNSLSTSACVAHQTQQDQRSHVCTWLQPAHPAAHQGINRWHVFEA